MRDSEISEEMIYSLLSEMVGELRYLLSNSGLVKYRAMLRLNDKFNELRSYSDAIKEINRRYYKEHPEQSQKTHTMPLNITESENENETRTPEEVPPEERTFTLSDLARYNGKNGMPAYIAYRGIVYDASKVPRWTAGQHFGLIAGRDMTIEYEACHAGRPTLDKMPIVGILVPGFANIV